MSKLSAIRIVLVGTTHPGNIGAAARAMKVMGLESLYLVDPAVFPSSEATAMASSADDLLASAVVCQTFEQAIAGCGLVLGTSARLRSLPLPQLDPATAAGTAVAESDQHPVAVVFGREKSGLNNEEMQRCNYLVHVPTSDTYQSLNLAQAVQVLAYEIRLAMLGERKGLIEPPDWQPEPPERLEIFFQRLEQTLLDIEFLNPDQPRRLMQRLRRLFLRARPDENELNILNGILSAVVKSTRSRPEE